MRSDLPRGDSQDPGERVALRIELARAEKNSKERLLRGVLGLRRRKAPRGQTSGERPDLSKDGIEGRPIAPCQRRQVPLEGALPRLLRVRSARLPRTRATPTATRRSRPRGSSCPSSSPFRPFGSRSIRPRPCQSKEPPELRTPSRTFSLPASRRVPA